MTKEELDKAMAYLDEKIKKASATWEGVDVDAYMDEVRGREEIREDIETEAMGYILDRGYLP